MTEIEAERQRRAQSQRQRQRQRGASDTPTLTSLWPNPSWPFWFLLQGGAASPQQGVGQQAHRRVEGSELAHDDAKQQVHVTVKMR